MKAPLPVQWDRMVEYRLGGIGALVEPKPYIGLYFALVMECGDASLMFLMSPN